MGMHKNWTTNKETALKGLEDAALLLKPLPYLKFASYDYHENFWNYTAFTDKKHESDLQMYFYGEDKSINKTMCDWAKDKEADWSASNVLEWVATQFTDEAKIADIKRFATLADGSQSSDTSEKF